MNELPEHTQKVMGRLHAILSILPATFLPVLWAYAVIASRMLGHWPQYNIDQQEFNQFNMSEVLKTSVAVSFWSVLMWLASAGLFLICTKREIFRRNVLVFIFAFGLVALQLFADPGGILEWYVD